MAAADNNMVNIMKMMEMMEELENAGKGALEAGNAALAAAKITGSDIDNLTKDANKEVTLTLTPEIQTLFVKSTDFIDKLKKAETEVNDNNAHATNANAVVNDTLKETNDALNKANTALKETNDALNKANDEATKLTISNNNLSYSDNVIDKYKYSNIMTPTSTSDFIYQIKIENNNIVAEINKIVKQFFDISAKINIKTSQINYSYDSAKNILTENDPVDQNALYINNNNIDLVKNIIGNLNLNVKDIKDTTNDFITTQRDITKIKDILNHYHDYNDLQKTKKETIDNIENMTNDTTNQLSKNIENMDNVLNKKENLNKIIQIIQSNIQIIISFFKNNNESIQNIDKPIKNINKIAEFNNFFAETYNDAATISQKIVGVKEYVTPNITECMLNAVNVEITKINIINDNGIIRGKHIISLPEMFKFINENENKIIIFGKLYDTFYDIFFKKLSYDYFYNSNTIIDDINNIYGINYNLSSLIDDNKVNAIKFAEFVGINLAIKCIYNGNILIKNAYDNIKTDTLTPDINIHELNINITDIKNAKNYFETAEKIKKKFDKINITPEFIANSDRYFNDMREIVTILDNGVLNNLKKVGKYDYQNYVLTKITNNTNIGPDIQNKINDLINSESMKINNLDFTKDNHSRDNLKKKINDILADNNKTRATCRNISKINDDHIIQNTNEIVNYPNTLYNAATSPTNVTTNVTTGGKRSSKVAKAMTTCTTNIVELKSSVNTLFQKFKTYIDDDANKYNDFYVNLIDIIFEKIIEDAKNASKYYYYSNNIAEAIVNATTEVFDDQTPGSSKDTNAIKNKINDKIEEMITKYDKNATNVINKSTRSDIGNNAKEVFDKTNSFANTMIFFTDKMESYSTNVIELNNMVTSLVKKIEDLNFNLGVAKDSANSFKELATNFNDYVNTSFEVKGGAKTKFANKYKCKNQKVGSIRKIKKLRLRNANTMKRKYLKRRTL